MSESSIVDVGNGLVSASLTGSGAWLSLGAAHSRHGFVELTGLPRFDPAWRGDPAAVRRYRDDMTSERFGFLGIELDDAAAHGRHEISAHASATEPRIELRHRILGRGRVTLRFRGRLDAHPLPEITEIAPPAPTGARTRVRADGERLLIEAPTLPSRAEVHVAVEGGTSSRWTVSGPTAQLVVTAARDAGLEIVVACTLREPAHARLTLDARPSARPSPVASVAIRAGPGLHVPASMRPALAALVERTRAYVLDCAAVWVGRGELCLLTDHRILPLSWTRDAYWQAAMLLARDPGGGAVDTVAAHLRWLWSRCERPDRFWMRSHHSNGAIKDVAFQSDQQIYPLLELADFRRATGTLPPVAANEREWWGAQVQELWDALPVGELGFVSSDENPADDESELPFLLSAQILYWLAATRMDVLREELELDGDFDTTARELAVAVGRHFQVEGPLGRQWAYAIDGLGTHRLYHDANDLPTALAPLLGFCRVDDPVWAATMRFGFSEHNPGWCAGPFGGLGSLHTPGTWTLGDVQEWVVASLLGEPDRAERALGRLLAVAGPDGLLPEAYDAVTGGSPIRHWFAWPGAALGTLLPASPGSDGREAIMPAR